MSDEKLVSVEREGGVAIVTLNRPDRLNALNFAIMTELRLALTEVAEDATVGCVVLTGAGRGFCAGGDLKDGGAEKGALAVNRDQGSRTEQSFDNLRRHMQSSWLLHEMKKPAIAMVNGPVAGAGIGLAGACDIRLASETATFFPAFDRIGAGGDFGSSWFWTKILGTGRARELFFLSPKLTAQEALAMGIYARVLPEAELRAATMEIAHRLANGPRMGWRYMKANLNMAEDASFEAALDHEALNMGLSTTATATIMKAEYKARKEAEAQAAAEAG